MRTRYRDFHLWRGLDGILRDGALIERDGVIEWVGAQSEIPAATKADREVMGGGKWMLPGLIDCHTHLVWAGNRSEEAEARLAGATYQEIAAKGGGILSTVRATREASFEDLRDGAVKRLAALAREGVRTVEIKSGYGLDLESELKILRAARAAGKAAGVRVVTTFLGAHSVPPEFKGRADEYGDLVCETMLPEVRSQGLADSVDVFCETVAFTPDQTRRIFSKAKELGFRVKLHADQLSDSGGGGIAAEFGALSADHLEHVSAESISKMAKAGTVAVLLPGAFYFLRETVRPPVAAMREAGVRMAVATDANPGTSPLLSLRTAMSMAVQFFGLSPHEALLGVTAHAASALGMGDELGSLEVGRLAEFSIFELDHPRDLALTLGDGLN